VAFEEAPAVAPPDPVPEVVPQHRPDDRDEGHAGEPEFADARIESADDDQGLAGDDDAGADRVLEERRCEHDAVSPRGREVRSEEIDDPVDHGPV
jgi:hypothetical protein